MAVRGSSLVLGRVINCEPYLSFIFGGEGALGGESECPTKYPTSLRKDTPGNIIEELSQLSYGQLI